jgi:hypothetical protein
VVFHDDNDTLAQEESTMRGIIICVFVAETFMPLLAAAPHGISQVVGGRREYSATALASFGETYLGIRDILVDIMFPSGRSGKGRITVVFEPASRLWFQFFSWEQKDYPAYVSADSLRAQRRFGVTSKNLIVIMLNGNAIHVMESTLLASSLDEAEARALKWHGERLAEIEAGANVPKSYGYVYEKLSFGRGSFPQDFFQSDYDSRPYVPIKLVDIARQDDFNWLVTVESIDTKKRAATLISRQGGPTKRVLQSVGGWELTNFVLK